MSLRKNILPAGSTLHENNNLSINDNNCHLVHLRWECKFLNSCSNDCFHSEVMLASMESVLICIPRNVRHVVGHSTLDGFIGALILLQNASIL